LGRFLAPDPFVGSGLTNDFNRYIYCRNNPLMFTDPSGMSFKEWWKSNVTDAFNRAFNSTFGNGQGGWEIGYNSSGGFFTNPTYNGRAIGPSAYYNPSNKQVSFGNGSSGFHDNTSSIRINNNIEQSVVQAEQGARGEYFGQKTFESSYNFMVNLANLAFKESEYEKLYGSEKQQGIPIDFDNAMNVGGTTFGVGAATEELSKLGYKNFKLVAIPFVGFNAYSAWDKASSPNATAINYMDFGMGVLDAGAALELFSRANIYVGGATLVYGLVRIGYDYYQSSSTNYYSPIYQINGKAVRLW
ncbi:MAG: RHS repeat-associated core domain-containing protein, partial [Paludibacter sp.]